MNRLTSAEFSFNLLRFAGGPSPLSNILQLNGLGRLTEDHQQCGLEQPLRVLVEPSNEWNSCLLSAGLHGGITSVSRLVIPFLSVWPGISVESHSTYLSMIFSGGAQIHKHLHISIDWFPGLQS